MFVHLLTVFIVIGSMFITPSSSFGYYIIVMKNGGELFTSQYWQEQDRVMFYINNGVMGLENKFIEKIVETDSSGYEVVETLIHNNPDVEKNDKKFSKKSPRDMLKKETEKLEESKAIKTAKQEPQQRDEYTEEFEKIKEEFKNIDLMTTKEIYQFSDRLTAFKNKIIKNNVAHVYQQQFMEAYTIGDQMEAVLNTRK